MPSRSTTLPDEYRNATPGLPARPLTVVAIDAGWPADVGPVVEELRGRDLDFVLLQRLSRRDAQAIAEALGFRVGGELQMYYSASNPDGRPPRMKLQRRM